MKALIFTLITLFALSFGSGTQRLNTEEASDNDRNDTIVCVQTKQGVVEVHTDSLKLTKSMDKTIALLDELKKELKEKINE